MGFLDSILGGKKKLKGPAPDRLFALSTAYVTLATSHGIEGKGVAAIVFQPLATADFEAIVSEMEEILRGTGEDTGTTISTSEDAHGYRWIVLRDDDIEDLVVGVNAVSDALMVGGYGDRVLAAVFAFKDSKGRRVYFIYNYKRGYWYPFVPAGGPGADADRQARDGERELQIKAIIDGELPIEPELERWFPLWGTPI
ncbi:MAG: PspA-associated protein PspAB [Solirubrobacteraceae bacterium]